MMFQHFHGVILFLVVGGFLHFLFFLFRTSGISSSHDFRKIILALWSGLLLLFMGNWLIQRTPKDRFRVACFPLISSDAWMDMIITDGINTLLGRANPTACLAYPVDWSYDAVAKDSASDVSYLRDYGKRIGLDLLITEQVHARFEGGCGIALAFYDLEKGRCILQVTDSLDFAQPDLFFRRVVRKAMDISSLFCDSLPSAHVPPARVWKDYGWGRYYQLHDDPESAERAYRSGIAVDSTQAVLLKGLASVLLEKGFRFQTEGKYAEETYLEAAKLLYQALEIDSADGQTFRLFGKLYIHRAWWNKAEKALRKSLQREKDDPFLYLQLTRLHPSRYKEMGFRNREKLLKHALSLNPALERAWIALGEDFYFRNKPEQAEEAYLKLLKIHPNSLDGLLALGKLYVFRNDVLNIIRVYERVLEIAPDYADAYYNLGIAYFNDGKEDESIRFFKRAVELNNHVDSHFYLGIIHARRGDRELAIEYFRKRIRFRRGMDDPFAEEARKKLYELIHTEKQTV